VKEAGEVLKEILNIPDDIPQDLRESGELLPCMRLRESASGFNWAAKPPILCFW